MASLVDERGFNQGFAPSLAQKIRLRRRAQRMVEAMRLPEELKDRKSIRILELGCGTGELAFELATLTQAKVTGTDLSAKFIDFAQKTHQHEQLSFKVRDLNRDGSEAGTYDFIVGSGILHHLYNNLEAFFVSLKQQLNRGGRLIFWEPNLKNPYIFAIFKFSRLRKLAKLEPEEMAFTAQYIVHKLRHCGFVNVSAMEKDFLLPNVPDGMINSVIRVGEALENIPFVRAAAQSIFIEASMVD